MDLAAVAQYDWEPGARAQGILGYVVLLDAPSTGGLLIGANKQVYREPASRVTSAFCELEFLGWSGGDAVFEVLEPWRGGLLSGLAECQWVYFLGQELKCSGAVVDGSRARLLSGLRAVNDTLDEVLA